MRTLLKSIPLLLLLNPTLTKSSNFDPRKCYLMDGTSAPSLTPCLPPPSSSTTTTSSSDSSTTHSPCCPLRNNTSKTATCLLPSGLCLSSNGLIYTSGCTDPTWTSPACPFVCPDARSNWKGKALEGKDWKQGQKVDHWQVMVCAPNSVCCRRFSGQDGCCENRSLRVEEFEVGMPVFRVWEGEGVNGDNGNGSATGTGTGGCERESQSAGTECREATVGAAVGAPLGAALVVTLAALAWAIRKQKVTAGRLRGVLQAQVQSPSLVSSPGYYKEDGARQVQRPGNHAELSATRQYELDGRSSA